ncbi:hypothetical protein H2248_006961 [Termitomyces sp. 'cryptogamus']|nr:hypothetical protein H2248_006961 [Termitomyces sp. 'cryptogamus']
MSTWSTRPLSMCELLPMELTPLSVLFVVIKLLATLPFYAENHFITMNVPVDVGVGSLSRHACACTPFCLPNADASRCPLRPLRILCQTRCHLAISGSGLKQAD